MSERPRRWTVEEAIEVMTAQGLSADMLPTHNELEQTWDVCLSDVDGNGVEYIAFATEEAADTFCTALGEAIERNAAAAAET